ncbi:hypothetical protein [Nocardioides dilutus]
MRLLRTLTLVGVVAAYLAVGPWALLLAVLALLVPRVRRAVWPSWGQLLVFTVVIAVAVGAVLVIPDGRLPIPPGGGLLVTPSFEGEEATPKPISLQIDQHPHLTTNGKSSMHVDGWATDAYAGPGPLGKDVQVDSAWYGVKECATLAFDSKDRIVGLCGSVTGPVLHVVDPDSMDPVDTLELPGRTGNNGKRPWEDICGGAYFYLDRDDRAFVGTTRRTIVVVDTVDLTFERTIDLTGVIPEDDCLVALMPDWDGLGTWWVSQDGRVGHAGESGESTVLDLDEEIANSMAVDAEGLYVVTVEALYKLAVGDAAPETLWRTAYDNGTQHKPGQLSAGSGTTPTVLPSGLVAITDNAEPRMHVQFYDARSGSLVCEAPVFSAAESATDNSLVAVGEASVVVENNYGYDSPLTTTLGRATPGGLARVDAVPADGTGGRECQVAWTSEEIAPTSVAKASLVNGLVYAYTTRSSRWGVQAWYVTAIDAATGNTAFSVRTGTGSMFNNHYSAVTLAPDGSLYVATLAGMVRLRDGD